MKRSWESYNPVAFLELFLLQNSGLDFVNLFPKWEEWCKQKRSCHLKRAGHPRK